MTDRDRRDWIDDLTARYLDALDRDDFDAQEDLWAIAAQHSDLETAFRELHDGLIEEAAAATTASVTDAVETHLKSATIVRPPAGPVTFADVAAELSRLGAGGLNTDAWRFNDELRAAAEPLPTELGLTSLIAFAEAKFGPVYGTASRDYWRAFREVALNARMRSNSQSAEYQLAARRAPKPEDRP